MSCNVHVLNYRVEACRIGKIDNLVAYLVVLKLSEIFGDSVEFHIFQPVGANGAVLLAVFAQGLQKSKI